MVYSGGYILLSLGVIGLTYLDEVIKICFFGGKMVRVIKSCIFLLLGLVGKILCF